MMAWPLRRAWLAGASSRRRPAMAPRHRRLLPSLLIFLMDGELLRPRRRMPCGCARNSSTASFGKTWNIQYRGPNPAREEARPRRGDFPCLAYMCIWLYRGWTEFSPIPVDPRVNPATPPHTGTGTPSLVSLDLQRCRRLSLALHRSAAGEADDSGVRQRRRRRRQLQRRRFLLPRRPQFGSYRTMDSRVDDLTRKRQEDDDEIMLFLLPAIDLLSSNRGRKKRARHTSRLPGKERLREILEGHPKDCCVAFCMEPSIFRQIADFLRTEHLLRDTRGVEVEERLGFFLFMLSHNASYEDLQYEFKHSGETIHRHIKAVFNIIPALAYRFLKPTIGIGTHWKISTDSRYFPCFQNCLGAIDGTHVPITISEDKQAPYRNRKGTLSQNVMVASDFDLNFTFISSGWEGSATDARVLRSALLRGFKVPEGKFYLVDGGYANTPSFLAPYHGVQYHLKEFGHGQHRPRNYKELFNHRHAVLRNHIERAIGVLKKRFPILKVGTHHPIENQVKIPVAAAVFHNLIQKLNGDEGWLDSQPDNISCEDFVDLPGGDNQYKNDVISLTCQIDNGNALRDTIAMSMWNDYSHSHN